MIFDLATAIPVKKSDDGEFSAIGQFDISTATSLDLQTQLSLSGKPIPEISAQKEPRYHRPASEEEKAQAVVELTYRERGQKVPFGLKMDWDFTSPEAKAISETFLLPMVTALKAARGIAEMNVPANSVPKMIIDSAKRGILEPDATEPVGASIVKAYPEVDWRVAGAMGTMAEFGILAPRLLTNIVESFSKESQFTSAMSEIRSSPIWQKGVARLSALKGIPPEQVDVDMARFIWENRDRVSYLRTLAVRSKYGAGVNLFDNAGYVRMSGGLQPGDLVRWGQEIGSVFEIAGDKAIVKIGKQMVNVAVNQLLSVGPELASKGFDEAQLKNAKPEAIQRIISENLKPAQVNITKSGNLKIIEKTPVKEEGLISKESVDKVTFAMLFDDEQKFVTARIMENKSLKQTAKTLGISLEDAAEEEKYIAKRIQEIKEAREVSPEQLRESVEKELEQELNVRRQELREYLEGKLKPELKGQGEYADLKHLDWLFAKEGELSYTPDELYDEINETMGFTIHSDDELRQLIKDYFIRDIRKEAAKSVAKIEKEARKKLEKALSGASRQKIEEEMRLGKLRIIAEQLTKLAEIAPRIVTTKQVAYAHILKEKKLLSDQQFARLKKIFTGKRTMVVTTPTGKLKKAPMTKEEAGEFINALQSVVGPRGPHITGEPPKIPTSKALMITEWNGPFNDLTDFQATPLSGLDPIRAAELVDGKPFGPVRKYVVEPAREAERLSRLELKKILDTLTEISEGMGSKSDASELVFKYIEKTLTPAEEKKVGDVVVNTANYMRKVYDELLERINQSRALVGKIPVQKRRDYITHIQELSLLDEFYQGLSNVPDDAINIPPFAKSNSPFFRFALQRLGGQEFKLDAIDAFKTYTSKAYSVIYNTPILKAARPLVNRLPNNAYKYFSQYLDETMALRPAQIDRVIPRSILDAISWLRRQMGKGAILGNLASACNQLFTIPNVMSAVGPKFFASATLKIHRPEWRAFVEAHSRILQGRIFEIDFDPTILSKVDNALGFLITFLDREMVRVSWGAAFEKEIARGSTFEDAIRNADDIAFRTQSSFTMADLPPAFRSKIAGSFLQFQNTVNNGLNYLRFDLGKEGTERGRLNTFKAGLMWLGTLLLLNRIYREFGIPSPIDEWTDVFPLVSMAEYGPPVTFSGPTALLQFVIAKTPQDKTKAARSLRRSIFLFLPAGNQVRKTLEGIYAVSEGGKFDKRGRLLFPITGALEKTRAVLFGPYGSKAGRGYIERGFKPESQGYRERVTSSAND